MLKEAMQFLISLKDAKTFDIGGDTYSDQALCRVEPHVDRPCELGVHSLESIVKLVRNELDVLQHQPLFIQVCSPRTACVFSTYDNTMRRDSLYQAVCNSPDFKEGFREHESAIIELRSRFIPNEGSEYLLGLLSRISKESGVTTKDNGVSQEVEARQGVSLKAMVSIKPRVALKPYRTFLEVDQPESEFLLRLDSEGRVGLFEADGGMWKLEAGRNIAAYFEKELTDLINAGHVVVMR